MKSEHILLIAPHGSYRTQAYLRAGKELNCRITLASQSRHSIVSSYQSAWHIDLTHTETALQQLIELTANTHISAVIGTDDLSLELVSRIAQVLKLPHNNPNAIRLTRRKDLARCRLQQAGLAVPEFRCIDLHSELTAQLTGFAFPGVLKPVNLSGSLGVIRVNDEHEYLAACLRIETILQQNPALAAEEKHSLILERYIPGFEIAVEGMLNPQGFELLCIFDKPEALEGPYFEESYYITPSRLDQHTQTQVVQLIQNCCQAYGLRQGAIHAECRINSEGIWLLEIAARTIGGMCAKLFEAGSGTSLEKRVLANAVQQSLPNPRLDQALGVLMIPTPKAGVLKGITGLQSARKIRFITDLEILIRPGHELIPLPDGSSYLGFIFARGPTANAVEAALRQAQQTLHFQIHPVWKIRNITNERQSTIPTG